jgi:hypothetical protein
MLYLPAAAAIVLHTYRSRFIPEGLAEASQIFLRDAHVYQNYLAMSKTADVTGDKPHCSLSQVYVLLIL